MRKREKRQSIPTPETRNFVESESAFAGAKMLKSGLDKDLEVNHESYVLRAPVASLFM